ncbi:polyamine aminopropyltransferase [Zooshikella ganghwensis]|uniref:polyamine aminopropyltransferase n=1 Tax=Zooshikella ganghwensis TaxID=202772 RepID=UPI001F2109A2|nr:polyamine aminopropyltransferase [Zooshikella ganghwensis]
MLTKIDQRETYLETLHKHYLQGFVVDKVLFENKTEHQHLIIFENKVFGRVMALDGIIQTTEADEFIYHEMLAHVPIMAHGNAKRVLIIGGGDGGMLREVLKHPHIEHVTMVEIDQQVVDMCREYLPNHSNGAFDDARTHLVIADGVDFVNTTQEQFDVIISDSTDPVGPGEVLFSSRFYDGCKRCLKDGGILVTQNGVAYMQLSEVTTTYQRLTPYFKDVSFYSAAVPTYIGGIMTFAWATNNTQLREQPSADIVQRFKASDIQTRYYNPDIHCGSFALPQYIHQALDAIAIK